MSHIPSALTERDFPDIYIASDEASKNAQKCYVRLIAADLILMIVAAAVAIYDYSETNSKFSLYFISAISLFFSLILTIVLLTKKYEDAWYQGRALAESCKTLSWRFMTQSELFEGNLSDSEVRNKFVTRISDLLREFSDLNKVLDAALLTLPKITKKMWDVRNLSLIDRKEYYIKYRIEDQKDWYSNKSAFNEKRYNIWFGIIIASQSFSLFSVIYLMICPDSSYNLVGLFTTVSSSALSWLQLKRHQELKQAYTTAAQELNMIVSLSDDISNETDFSKFVLDSENAVSREHTLWLAQRRK